jgi:hypothetical protein
LAEVFNLGTLYVSNFISQDQEGKTPRAPLELVLCDRCSLLQLRHTAPQELLYARFYWYRSGVTETMRKALQDIAEAACRAARPRAGEVALDIGANDGTLLDCFPDNLIKVGCEPATNLLESLRGKCDHTLPDFWSYEAYRKLALPKAKIVTAIGMFYDMENPNQFVSDAARAMADDGIFIAQLMCLKNMLQTNDVGNICHEHLEYYSLATLKRLFEQNGLEILKIEENDVNGGSYRIYARRFREGSIPLDERFTRRDYLDFFRRVEENKKKCVDFIRTEVGRGKRIYVYGASTKGNTILQYYGLDRKLLCGAAEKSPEKWGRFTVGTMIPILSEEEARKDADYFLVLPYAFLKEFLRREENWRTGGGRFIVPIPEFQVL